MCTLCRGFITEGSSQWAPEWQFQLLKWEVLQHSFSLTCVCHAVVLQCDVHRHGPPTPWFYQMDCEPGGW